MLPTARKFDQISQKQQRKKSKHPLLKVWAEIIFIWPNLLVLRAVHRSEDLATLAVGSSVSGPFYFNADPRIRFVNNDPDPAFLKLFYSKKNLFCYSWVDYLCAITKLFLFLCDFLAILVCMNFPWFWLPGSVSRIETVPDPKLWLEVLMCSIGSVAPL